MTRRDAGLKMICAEFVAGGRLTQMHHSARNHCLIPSRTVLLVEPKNIPLGIGARGQARGVEQHERKQRVRARLVSGRMLRQQGRQTNRFLAKLLSYQMIAARWLVTFVEKQVESLQDSVQTPR